MRLQSAIFDMDGTLLDSMPAWNHLGSDLLRRHGIEPAADLDQRLKVLSARQGAALCREEYHLTETVPGSGGVRRLRRGRPGGDPLSGRLLHPLL